ncbi:hypothetical protein ACFVZD_39785 [Streptomyces sp. NPDC058287]|uniref:hypothetical protein n=1 Tax=unclassified Streptomyces TaxID=2593676 RepID=UPI0036EB5268
MRARYERLRKASPKPASPTHALPSAALPEGESRRSAYVSESDDAEIMDVAAAAVASATDGWAIGRGRVRVSTATEKAGGDSTFFLHYDGESWHEYDAAGGADAENFFHGVVVTYGSP